MKDLKFYNREPIKDKREYAWNYFNIHAEQRLKTFHFYIIIITLLLGAIFSLFKENYILLTILMSCLLSFFSFVFWKLDLRNKELIRIAESELKRLEKSTDVQLFSKEKKFTNIKKNKENNWIFYQHFTFSESFNFVFITFGIIGILIVSYCFLNTIQINENMVPDILTHYDSDHSFNISSFIILLTSLFISLFVMLTIYFGTINYGKNIKKSLFISLAISFPITLLDFESFISFKPNEFNLVKTTKEIEKVHIMKKVKSINLYFNKGGLVVKNLDKSSIQYSIQKSNIQKLNTLLNSVATDKYYYFKIVGFASLEKISDNNNKILDNYQISFARSNNTKKHILQILNQKKIPRTNIQFDTFANSNELIDDQVHHKNRKVEIEIFSVE